MLVWRELTNELAEAYLYSSRGLWRPRLWTGLAHTYNHSSHAVECSFNYKKILLKFLLSDTGFIGTRIPIAVQCQIKRNIRGRKQKKICAIEKCDFQLACQQSKWHGPCRLLLSSQVKVGEMEINARLLTAVALSPALFLLGSNKRKGLRGELAFLVPPKGHLR